MATKQTNQSDNPTKPQTPTNKNSAVSLASAHRACVGRGVTMRVFVVTLTGDRYTVTADLGDTVAAVKAKVHEAGGPLPGSQRLIYCGRECSDEVSLQTIGIQADSSFHLVASSGVMPEEVDRTAQELEVCERARLQLEVEVAMLAENLQACQQAADEATAEAAEAERAARERDQAHAEERQRLEAEVARLEEALRLSSNDLDDAKAQAAATTRQHQLELEREVARAMGDVQQCREALQKATEALALAKRAARDEAEAHQEERGQLQDKVEGLASQVAHLEEDRRVGEQEEQRRAQHWQALRSEVEETKRTLREVAMEAATSIKDAAQAAEARNVARAEAEAQAARAQQAESQLAAKDGLITQLQDDVTALQTRVAAEQERVAAAAAAAAMAAVVAAAAEEAKEKARQQQQQQASPRKCYRSEPDRALMRDAVLKFRNRELSAAEIESQYGVPESSLRLYDRKSRDAKDDFYQYTMLSPQSLARVGPADRQRMIGERLYVLVESELQNPPHRSTRRACKITGMLLDGVDTQGLLCLLESPAALAAKVNEALEVLAEADDTQTVGGAASTAEQELDAALARYRAEQAQRVRQAESRATAADSAAFGYLQEVNALRVENAALRGTVAELRTEKDVLQERITAAEQAAASLRAQVEALQAEKDRLYSGILSVVPEAVLRAVSANASNAAAAAAAAAPAPAPVPVTAPEAIVTAPAEAAEVTPAASTASSASSDDEYGVGDDILFLETRDKVRVVGDECRAWRLATGRVAKKRTMGRSWVWCPRLQQQQQTQQQIARMDPAAVFMELDRTHRSRARLPADIDLDMAISASLAHHQQRALTSGGGGGGGGSSSTSAAAAAAVAPTRLELFCSKVEDMGLDPLKGEKAFHRFNGDEDQAVNWLLRSV